MKKFLLMFSTVLMLTVCLCLPVSAVQSATFYDVVISCHALGFSQTNLASLNEFFVLNEDEFTPEDFADMIGFLDVIRSELLDDYCFSEYLRSFSELTYEEKYELYYGENRIPDEMWSDIVIAFQNFLRTKGIAVSLDYDLDGYPLFYFELGQLDSNFIIERPSLPSSDVPSDFPQFESDSVLPAVTEMVTASIGWITAFVLCIMSNSLLLIFIISVFAILGLYLLKRSIHL